MASRAIWKGFLRIAEVSCPVSLYAAASTSERIGFHTLNRATGNRLRRQYVDSATGKSVENEDQSKGFEVADGEYITLTSEEIADAVPKSDKTLDVANFIACDKIDDVYFDRPYYLTPSDPSGEDAFVLIREGMSRKKVAALARTVLFRRERTVLIRPHEQGMIATTLNFDYEVRAADEVFKDIPKLKIKGEMLDLAKHIISTKMGEFDIAEFDDRYDEALRELVKAKLEGRKMPTRKLTKRENVVDLMTALRESAKEKKATESKKSGKARKSG